MTNDKPENLSAELVIGTLESPKREAALKQLENDAGFAKEVEAWQNYLSPLSEVLPPQKAPDSVLHRIENILDKTEAENEKIVPLDLIFLEDKLNSLEESLGWWKRAALSFGAVAAALIVTVIVLITSFPAVNSQQRYFAVLRDDRGQEGFVVVVEDGKKRIMVKSLDMRPPPSKSYELWIMSGENKKPATLGLVATHPNVRLKAPELINRIQKLDGVKLAVSIEPEGGAPKGSSMGRVMFSGKFIPQPL